MKRMLFILIIIYFSIPIFSQSVQRVPIASINSALNTGMDYSSWLTDNLDTLVQSAWGINNQYVDVTITLPSRTRISKLSLYDYTGVFATNPAYLYTLKDTQRIFFGLFEGRQYKVYVDLPAPDSATYADAIIVRKYANNIPQKVQIYGVPSDTAAPTVQQPPASAPADTTALVPIPINPKRWYTLNNLAYGLDSLFDGVTNSSVNTGFSSFITNYDSYYPIENGEKIVLKQIKLYDSYGSYPNTPATICVIKSNGRRDTIATFNGSAYQTWVGPYPYRTTTGNAMFNLDSAITDIKYIVLNCTNSDLPTEIQFYGNYIAPPVDTTKAVKQIKLKNELGVNGFEWDFVNPSSTTSRIIDSTKFALIKSFGGFRQYQDWKQIELGQDSFSFNPTRSGGWNYDIIYDSCKRDSIDMLVCMQNIPQWMVNTYPSNQQFSDNNPVKHGSDYADPQSYLDKGKAGFEMAARYGINRNVDPTLIHINTTPRWTSDPTNTVKIGLGTVKYLECTNESDKWWRNRIGYMTPYELAACMSAFYDGNKNTMGAGVGVKNADSTMKVVMGGIACRYPSYVRGMIEWCRQYRGYKADGSINLCWDVINYHHYFNNNTSPESNNSTNGVAPEKSDAAATAIAFIQLAHSYAGDMPVWVTETGYDQNQGSPDKAIAIGNKTVAQTQADWLLRTSLTYIRQGIEKTFFYQTYDGNINSGSKYASMGMFDTLLHRKPAADYIYQVNKLFGQYVYVQTINSDPVVDQYNLNGVAGFVLTVPDQIGRIASYTLHVGNYDSAIIYTPLAGSDTMSSVKVALTNGAITIAVSETPEFVIPLSSSIFYTKSKKVSSMYLSKNSVSVAFLKKDEKRNL